MGVDVDVFVDVVYEEVVVVVFDLGLGYVGLDVVNVEFVGCVGY